MYSKFLLHKFIQSYCYDESVSTRNRQEIGNLFNMVYEVDRNEQATRFTAITKGRLR